jgi:Nif-specific regulatory protein
MPTTDSASRLRLLYELGCAFAARIELDDLIPLVVKKCCEAFDAEGASLLLLDGETNQLYFPYAAGASPAVEAQLARARFPADRGIAGTVLQDGAGIRVDDVQSHPRFYPEIDRVTGLTTCTLISAPLATAQGKLGVIEVVNRVGGPFTDEDLVFLEALAGSIAVAIDNARLYARVKGSEETLRTQVAVLRRDLARRDRFTEIVGTSPAMADVLRLMDSAAASPIAVLIEGETGTGKELVARGIHQASARAEAPFVAVNCAALPEPLLESQLFGHRRGAFTGATQDHRGFFEAASGGTILLDEVGDMPPAMQAKLLRVLQEGEVVPVGDTRVRRVDVRIVSATNSDLRAAVAARSFREDLYYRLAAFPIRIPPLRDRREDIPLLVGHMLGIAAARHHKTIPGVAQPALDLLVAFDWPGNIRELQNEIERAVALAHDGMPIGLEHLSPKLGPGAGVVPVRAADAGEADEQAATAKERAPRSLRRARAVFEARHIAETLKEQEGNVSRAAEALGLSRVMLQKKMKDYRLR